MNMAAALRLSSNLSILARVIRERVCEGDPLDVAEMGQLAALLTELEADALLESQSVQPPAAARVAACVVDLAAVRRARHRGAA